jgi:hypothetical protein
MKSGILQATIGILMVVPMLTALSVANIGVASAQELGDDSFDGFDNGTSGNQTGLASSDFGNSSTHGMSFLGAFGVSMVDGVRVTGVVLDSEDEVSATITSENGTTQAVTVVAFSGTMDMMSAMMMQSGSMALMDESGFGNSSSSTAMTGNFSGSSDDDSLEDLFTDDDSLSFNLEGNDTALGSTGDLYGDDGLAFGSPSPFMDFFENVKMGSSIVEEGWSSPQQVTVTLVDNSTDGTVPPTETEESDTTFVFVMVFPYTEEGAAPETVMEG